MIASVDTAAMDLDNILLNPQAPVIYPKIFSALQFLWRSVKQVTANQEQLRTLVCFGTHLLQALSRDSDYCAGQASQGEGSTLDDFRRLLKEISTFVRKEASKNFLKSLITKDTRVSQIEDYHHRVCLFCHAFKLHRPLSVTEWRSRNDDARCADQRLLNDKFDYLQENDDRLMEILNTQVKDVVPMILCLQKRLDEQLHRNDQQREREFLSHTLECLTAFNGFDVVAESWMITPYEVDFGCKIGVGGFSKVYKGIWKHAEVAIKIFKTQSGQAPSSAAIRREIETWSALRHMNILQFLGASEWDDEPFIVMPYMKNGSARDYVRAHPDCNRLQIIHQISLGLIYLHSQLIVHGDLKALNVLIGDGGNALLCDFGISRIRSDLTTHTGLVDTSSIVGSRNWLAPERLLGAPLKTPCDIYAFGMTIYEIFTDEVPLGEVGYVDFIELVVERNVRPERPEAEDAPSLSDGIWAVATKCWVKEPKQRPTAEVASDDILKILQNSCVTTPVNPCLSVPLSQPLADRIPASDPTPDPAGLVSSLSPSSRYAAEAAADDISQIRNKNIDSPVITPVLPVHPHSPIPSRQPLVDPITPVMAAHNRFAPVSSLGSGVTAEAISSDTSQISENGIGNRIVTHVPPVDHQSLHSSVPSPQPSVNHIPSLTVVIPTAIERVASDSPVRSLSYQTEALPTSHIGPIPTKFETGLLTPEDDQPTLRYMHPPLSKVVDTAAQLGSVEAVPVHHVGPIPTKFETGLLTPEDDRPLLRCVYPPPSKAVDNVAQLGSVEAVPASSVHPTSILRSTSAIYCFAFSSDGSKILSGAYDGTIRVWDAKTGDEVLATLGRHKATVLAVAFSPDGKRIASGDNCGELIIWDSNLGTKIGDPLRGHPAYITAVAFSPDGHYVASASLSIINVWDTRTGGVIKTFRGGMSIYCIVFVPDGNRIVTGGSDGMVRFWNVQTGEPLYGPIQHSTTVIFLSFSSDYTKIVSGDWNGVFRVWDAETRAMTWGPSAHPISSLSATFQPVSRRMAVSPNGRWVVKKSSSDQTFELLDAITNRPLYTGRTDMVWHFASSPDGKHFASCSLDGSIHVFNWPIETS